MPNKALLAFSLVGCLLASAEVWANDDAAVAGSREPVSLDTIPQADSPPSWDVILNNGEYGGKMGRIPPGTKVRKYRIDAQGQTQDVEAFSTRAGTKVIYSNTNTLDPLPGGGRVGAVWARGAGARISDDMTTQAVNPCELVEVRVDVHGGNLDPDDFDPGEFGVTLQLWDGCPNGGTVLESSPGVPLPPFTIDGLFDNEVSQLTITLPSGTIPPSTTIWVSGIFDTDFVDPLHIGAGFIVGSPPEKGFSMDAVETPTFGCAASFGGWPIALHASIAAQVLAVDTCETHFFAYLAENNSKETFDRGTRTRIAEDIALTIDGCELSTYEIGVIGQARGFQLKADLRRGLITGPSAQPTSKAIPGTEGVFLGQGQGDVEIARFAFPPGIPIPQELWVTWTISRRNTGAILTQDTQIGTGSDLFAFEDPSVGKCTLTGDQCEEDPDCQSGEFCNFWTTENFAGPKTGIFYVAVNCRGEAPTGACCRIPKATDPPGGVCADNVTAAGCPQGRWARDARCDDVPAPFNPPCGTAACCFENSEGGSDCTDLTKDECDVATGCSGALCIDQPGKWQPGNFCDDDDFQCLWFACFFSTGEFESCLDPHPTQSIQGDCQRNSDCRAADGWYWGCDRPATCSGSGQPCDGACGQFDKVCSGSDGWCRADTDCPVGETCTGACLPFNNDCPPGETCDLKSPTGTLGVCAYPTGCNNSRCCDTVCRNIFGQQLGCCKPGAGWKPACTTMAQDNCSLPVTNDECFSFDPDTGRTQEATLVELGETQPDVWEAVISVNNLAQASWNFIPGSEDPDICCSNAGINEPAAVSEWFLFESLAGSVLVSTCDSDGQTGQDTILQVFKTGTLGTPAQQCDDLIPLACNDDAGCGTDGRMSAVCVKNIAIGEPAYIQLSTPGFNNADRRYKLSIRQPCPTGSEPAYTRCDRAKDAPVGAAEVLFDCPDDDNGGPGLVCLRDTTLACEGLDPGEACFTAMKNDVWINYTPSCTGILSVNSCESSPVTSPDTTMAIYGANVPFPSEAQECPDGGALLLDCNDDADVNAEEHELRPQECTLGRNACDVDDDCPFKPEESCINNVCVTSCAGTGTCPLPGQVCAKACSLSGDVCNTDNDCLVPSGQTCVFDECIRPCDTDLDCTLATCSTAGNLCVDDNDCDVGLCSWDQRTVCEVSIDDCPWVCRLQPRTVCDRFADPGDPLYCLGGTGPCISQTCLRDEVCVGEVCASECWPGSTMKLPVSQNRSYKIRLGGEFGSEPEGSLKFECVDDGLCALLNGVPNICSMDCNAMNGACNQWRFAGCGITQDCHSANKRCTISGSYDLAGTPCLDDSDCAKACSVSGTACLDDIDCPVAETCDPTGETCSSGFSTFNQRFGIPDNCDIEFGRSDDCDPIGPDAKNGMPDECEIRDDPSKDLDGNGVLDVCEISCPDGPMAFSNPMADMTDARQPHPIDDAATAQGFDVLHASGPANATDLNCWSLAEVVDTAPDDCGNSIVSVVEDSPGVYTITLDHVLPSMSTTTITYTWGSGFTDGVFKALPGDVDASDTTDMGDIAALITCLSGGGCDLWSCDIDQLRNCTGADLERLIDLLNAAGQYLNWDGATIGTAACP